MRAPIRRSLVMGLDLVPTGRDVPNEINVIIEIPKDAEPVKYEVDKATGAIFVDRILSTPMRYPCNYGYVPHTLCGDGDPADVLVILPLPLVPGSVIRCRPVGVLQHDRRSRRDEKLLAVPSTRCSPATPTSRHRAGVEALAGAHRPLLRALQGSGEGQVGQARRLEECRRGAPGNCRIDRSLQRDAGSRQEILSFALQSVIAKSLAEMS
jgi:inorganic pyrophosphatase